MSDGIGPVGGGGGPDVLSRLRSGRIVGDRSRLRAATQLLEGTFYQEMFKAMRNTVPEGGALSGGQGQEMFEGMLDQQMADAAAARSENGLGGALYRYFATALGMEADPEAPPMSSSVDTEPSIEGPEDE